MSWKQSSALEERMKFVEEAGEAEENMAELCRHFGISRKTGYKWIERHASNGMAGLAEQSRAPHKQAQAITDNIRQQVLAARSAHRSWGPLKLKRWLENTKPAAQWPSASTIGEILQQAGLNHPRGKHLWVAPIAGPLAVPSQANDIWCADFKGNFDCQDGSRCDPLTITDSFSRYLLRCQLVQSLERKYTQAWFETSFQEFGMPKRIRTDNGSPFASTALAGLSELSVWWIKLGIQPERIQPGRPQQNGQHERMHRTLKESTATPPAQNKQQQQQRFNAFRREYNEQRPHQALDMATPASLYQASPRAYKKHPKSPEYGPNLVVRQVASCGRIRWSGDRIFITKVLPHEPIGLEQVEDQIWKLWYGTHPIGWMDERTLQASDPDRPPKGSAAATEKAKKEDEKRAHRKNQQKPSKH